MPVLIQRERTSRWLNLAVVWTLIAIIAIDLFIYFKPPAGPTPEQARAAELVEGWLDEQKKGGDGLRFWAPGELIEPAQFHAVRSWKIIHVEPFDHALVQVDSQTAGGDPVSKLWRVSLGMGPDRAPLITRIVDAGDLSPPTHLLARVLESPRARQMRLEKEQAEARLAGLSRTLHELENETEGKLRRLTDSLIQQKRDMNRQIEDQTYCLERLTAQIETTRNEAAAAKDRARSVQTADFRFTLPALAIPDAKRVTQRASTGSAPIPVDQAYHYFLKKAEDVYRAGNYPEAAGMYSELVEKYPKARTPYLRRGDCYASLEEFDRAIADFDVAIKLLPLEPRAYLARSWAHLSKGATSLALADAEEALRLEPALAEAHLIRTEVFARKGQSDQAATARSDALAAFYRRGVSSIMKREYDQGIADLERVVRGAPDQADAHAWCAKAHYLRSDFPGAVREFTRLIALRPDDKQSYNDRGMAHFRAQALTAAMADFDHAIRLDPKFPDAYLNRATVRLAVGDAARAVADLSTVIQLDPRNATAYRLRSVAADRMGFAVKAASDRHTAESLGQ